MQQGKIPTVIIIGAGPGGLSLYHALMKNKDKKEFNVKIFERETSPKDRWQGYNIGLNPRGVRSLLSCIPPSVASNLPKAIPNPIPNVEFHGITIADHQGNVMFRPPTKQVKEVYELSKITDEFCAIIGYRDRLRDVLLDGVPVQWGKKCIGFEETENAVWAIFEDGSRESSDILIGADGINSPVRKQKVPELQIFDYGVTYISSDIPVKKSLVDRLMKTHGDGLFQKSLGIHGDWTFNVFRLVPIEQDPNYKNKDDFNEPHYRVTISYAYPSKIDTKESDGKHVDDNDPTSVIKHVKQLIRKFRPDCEMTDVLLELWDLVPKTDPNDPEKYPFKTYNPVTRRKLRDVDPLSVNSWKSSRVTLLGDAAHAMSPVLGLGTNNAIEDAYVLSQALINYSSENYISCIQEYEKEMLKRTSADVLKSRSNALRISSPVGYFGLICRNSIFKALNIFMNLYYAK
ncbi:94_t:CDS:2 [Funneliformis mosseae]|uniref:94_t:CDS:1 n=1 Tax=Funneliformis mosseae TaxID=27381 RepID=A0A9N9FWJ1_FUNMO|nr:94_t:CDS:2 [Funneliformis mosseae]